MGGSAAPLQPSAAGRVGGCWGRLSSPPSPPWTCAACAISLGKRPAVSGVCRLLSQSAVRRQGFLRQAVQREVLLRTLNTLLLLALLEKENKRSLDASPLCCLFVLHLLCTPASWSVPWTPVTANASLSRFPSCQEFPWLLTQALGVGRGGRGCVVLRR